MANTLTVTDGLSALSLKYPRLLTDGFGARIADEVISFIWNRYPWRVTLAELPPFYPVREVADYGPPTFAVPDDFKGLHDAWMRRYTGEVIGNGLIVKPSLPISIAPDMPTAISFQPERGSFRLHPRPSFSGPEVWVEGVYKKQHVKVTNDNMNSYILPWDDEYFQVFKEGLKWKYKADVAESPDAPGQFALFRAFIDDMAVAEGLHSGIISIAPYEGLELGG